MTWSVWAYLCIIQIVMLRFSESTCVHEYEREHIFTWTEYNILIKEEIGPEIKAHFEITHEVQPPVQHAYSCQPSLLYTKPYS